MSENLRGVAQGKCATPPPRPGRTTQNRPDGWTRSLTDACHTIQYTLTLCVRLSATIIDYFKRMQISKLIKQLCTIEFTHMTPGGWLSVSLYTDLLH